MQQFVDGLPVGSIGQRLFEQATQAAKVAFQTAKFQAGFLMLQTGHGEPQANPFTEGRE